MDPVKAYVPLQDEYATKTIENFLSDDELDLFWSYIDHPETIHEVDNCMRDAWPEFEHECTAHYHIFSNFNTSTSYEPLRNILLPKIKEHFGDTLKLPHIHILRSRFPYGLHNDANQSAEGLDNPLPAWTLIIPFETVNSKTYVFDQRSDYKSPEAWIYHTDPPQFENPAVDKETYERDFAPFTSDWIMHYLTVESVFEWKRGSCFAADRYKYHASDNYFNHGLQGKDAIIIWTAE